MPGPASRLSYGLGAKLIRLWWIPLTRQQQNIDSSVWPAGDEILGMPCNSPRFAPGNDTLLKGMNDAVGNDLIDSHKWNPPYQVKKGFVVLKVLGLWGQENTFVS